MKYLIVTQLILNFFFLFYYRKISNIFNLFDHPDGLRKVHSSPVPILGFLILFLNLSIFFVWNFFFQENNYIEILHLKSNKHIFIFFVCLLSIMCLGIYDDKFTVAPNIKLLLSTLIIYSAISVDAGLQIGLIKFSFTDYNIVLGNTSILFTTLCILLFLNAMNMFDGINLQAGGYYLIIFLIFAAKGIDIILILSVVIALIIFLFLNFKEKIFLGDGGNFLLSTLSSYIFIKSYNDANLFTADEIVLYMLVPGIDMFRLFLVRLMQNKHPFLPDRNHIHHKLIDRFGYNKAIIITMLLILFPIVFYNFIYSNAFLSITLILLVYFSILFFLKRKKINE